jgi:hypothetical protein
MTSDITKFSVVLTDNKDVLAGGAELKSGFFTTAKVSSEVQPVVLIDSQVGGNDYIVQCDMTKVAHGTMSNGGTPAMLAVFEFVFLPRGATKRFLEAEIEIAFSERQLARIAPKGMWGTLKSEMEREVTHTVSPSVEVGVDPVKTSLGYTWELKETSARVGYANLRGAMLHKKTTALWGLSENTQTKSGLPSLLRKAVLLERERSLRLRVSPTRSLLPCRSAARWINWSTWTESGSWLSATCRAGGAWGRWSSLTAPSTGERSRTLTTWTTRTLLHIKHWSQSRHGRSRDKGRLDRPNHLPPQAHPGTGTVGNTRPIHHPPETTQRKEMESISILITPPSSTTAAASNPLHKALSILAVD